MQSKENASRKHVANKVTFDGDHPRIAINGSAACPCVSPLCEDPIATFQSDYNLTRRNAHLEETSSFSLTESKREKSAGHRGRSSYLE